MFTNEIIYSNIVFFLSRYAFWIANLFKNKYIKFIINILKYVTYGYAFYLLKGYSGIVMCSYLLLFIILGKFNLFKSIIIKTLLTILLFMICYLLKDYHNVFYLMVYLFILIRMWIKPLIKNNKRMINFFTILEYTLLAIYSWNIKAYVLFIFFTQIAIFNISGLFLSKVVSMVNDNIL